MKKKNHKGFMIKRINYKSDSNDVVMRCQTHKYIMHQPVGRESIFQRSKETNFAILYVITILHQNVCAISCLRNAFYLNLPKLTSTSKEKNWSSRHFLSSGRLFSLSIPFSLFLSFNFTSFPAVSLFHGKCKKSEKFVFFFNNFVEF